jgi:hypothetical protein
MRIIITTTTTTIMSNRIKVKGQWCRCNWESKAKLSSRMLDHLEIHSARKHRGAKLRRLPPLPAGCKK